MRRSNIRTASAFLLLLPLIASCGSAPVEPAPQVVTRTETIREIPPERFTRDCPIPNRSVQMIGDIDDLALDRGRALVDCNAQIEKLRTWYEEAPE